MLESRTCELAQILMDLEEFDRRGDGRPLRACVCNFLFALTDSRDPQRPLRTLGSGFQVDLPRHDNQQFLMRVRDISMWVRTYGFGPESGHGATFCVCTADSHE